MLSPIPNCWTALAGNDAGRERKKGNSSSSRGGGSGGAAFARRKIESNSWRYESSSLENTGLLLLFFLSFFPL